MEHQHGHTVEDESKENRLDAEESHESGHHAHAPWSKKEECGASKERILTIRSHSGLSGDMFLAGLLRMADLTAEQQRSLLRGIMPKLEESVFLEKRMVGHIAGWHCRIDLPHEHEHRTAEGIIQSIAQSAMSAQGKVLAENAFRRLAEVEGAVHGCVPKDVHFHEVGALDSILDICASCELFARLAINRLVVSAIPLCDGSVRCAHGLLPVPAPAVLELLSGILVRPFDGEGETLTPTAAVLLQTFGAEFGPWPLMVAEKCALVYGDTVFAHVPNGATFVLGHSSTPLV